MVEDVEELRVEAKGDVLGDSSLLRHVNLGVGEMRPSVVVAAGVAELAVNGRISTGASAGAGIDDGDKGAGFPALVPHSFLSIRFERFSIGVFPSTTPAVMCLLRIWDCG
jgi:hypothetical protein